MNGGWQVNAPRVPRVDTGVESGPELWLSASPGHLPSQQMHALHRAAQGHGVPSPNALLVPQTGAPAKSTPSRVFHEHPQSLIKAAGEEREGKDEKEGERKGTSSIELVLGCQQGFAARAPPSPKAPL